MRAVVRSWVFEATADYIDYGYVRTVVSFRRIAVSKRALPAI